GFFGKVKTTWDSYETLTEDEIAESIKQLHISRKKFEEVRDECIKSQQISSFAGCSGRKHNWRRWDEMNEKEFEDTLKYFNISREKFEKRRESCSN
ncbi:MAG: hypothetical protein WA019_04285, partial [Candidatus Moraniibacteriota bacterium]